MLKLLFMAYFVAVSIPITVLANGMPQPTLPSDSILSNNAFHNFTDFSNAVSQVQAAVVRINTKKTVKTVSYDQSDWDIFQNPSSQGSGVIITRAGHIVTNHHVVVNSDFIEVSLWDGRYFEASIVGLDPLTDLAVIKINARELEPATYGDSEGIKIGSNVMALGNPRDMPFSVSTGIVSAKDRILKNAYETSVIQSFIQTDAVAIDGNSGGALIDGHGKLIGIVTAVLLSNTNGTSFSFAIPSDMVQKITNDIIEYGVAQHAFLGIEMRNIDNETARRKRLRTTKGVLVILSYTDGPAYDANIQRGDVILEVHGKKVGNIGELNGEIALFRPGDKVALTYLREGEKRYTTLVLKDKENRIGRILPKISVMTLLGAEFKELLPSKLDQEGLKYGIQVGKLENGFLQKNTLIQEGFIISEARFKQSQKAIKSINALESYIESLKNQGVRSIQLRGKYPGRIGFKEYTLPLTNLHKK
ncbi:MAG: S1C family serine protease [Chitinophagales bacterium]